MQVGRIINLSGTKISNGGKTALDMERAKIGGDVFIRGYEVLGAPDEPAVITGGIVIVGATIGASLIITQGASIGGAAGDPVMSQAAIAGEGLRIGGYLNLARSSIKGLVMLRDLQVARTANLSGTKISNPGKIALDMERAKVGGDVFIRSYERTDAPAEPAAIIGGIFMTGAKIDGSLFIHDGSVQNGNEELRFNRMNVSGIFRFANIVCGSGRVSLANSKVFTFADDGTSWPSRGSLLLNGFEYGSLTGQAQTGWRTRLEWLRRFGPDDFNPQPFTTLSTVLRRTGYDRDAKRIAIARHREARKYMRIGSPRWLGNAFMDASCGHGYRPWLAAMWVVFFIGVGFKVFNLDVTERVPLKEPAAALYAKKEPLPGGYPEFQPLLYSADVLLPIVNLQQKDYWAPNSAQPRGYWARLYLPFHILAGWFFTTLFVVGVTGLIRRE
jgi:hypothetical protein